MGHVTAQATGIRWTRHLKADGGFTLIELIAVMVIVAVLAAAAVPSLEAMGDTRSTMAARQLLRDITFARQRSVATGAPTWVVFDASAQTWSVLGEDPAALGRAGASTLNDPATGRPFVQRLNTGSLVGVRIVSVDFDTTAEVGFDWLGRPLSGAESSLANPGVVTLTGGHQVTVAVSTGHAAHVAP